ncbi:hypothetical protein HPO96_07930 [Kribbella sandramycini]|uniref:Uncharacterized protein n=1 Tax=Kribbella sandramycini TaxID=60450 RepID=A0A7Y4KWV8_9ACTN|nr:hypothetical protein [Kribbella sandramycini]MBB6570007.1 hypothetical protein [Kribbella sandramycini]NOL40169.1 hypothetical protein [Kribbella sandramycini]
MKRAVVVGLVAAGAVVAAAGVVRYDVGRIDGVVLEARAAGDCAVVRAAAERYHLVHKVVGRSAVRRSEADVAACGRLDAAGVMLDRAVHGSERDASQGVGVLDQVLADPEQLAGVRVVVDRFVAALRVTEPCLAGRIAEEVRGRAERKELQERIGTAIAEVGPRATSACADELVKQADWKGARQLYQQVIERYPDDLRVAAAKAGAQRATEAIELADVRGLVDPDSGTYCDNPAKYSAAPPYRKGLNRTILLGDELDPYASRLPKAWRTSDPKAATIVVCVDVAQGKAVRTCPYQSKLGFGPVWVTFRKVVFNLKTYELRTGRLIRSGKVEVDGTSCPRRLYYQAATDFSNPEPNQFVTPTSAGLRAAFQPTIVRR